MNGTGYGNFDNQEHVLKLGETFEKNPPKVPTTLCGMTSNQLLLTQPVKEIWKWEKESKVKCSSNSLQGSKRPYMKECILIVNHDTGDMTGETQQQHSCEEDQTSRLSQQVKNNSTSSNSSNNKSSTSSKSSPIKEKTSPASPMDDIERELMAEARVMDQLSSGGSSSDSNSSSSSSSEESSSSSDSEDEPGPRGALSAS
ncbi:ELL-associated factor 2 [Oryzias melastigma]|uniref:ELL-associated factor 2 n=1 Tax=Oryzias melastigma TaxID=30732 RepID=A0A834F2Q2_ORYME|nr:ELL-associated factor 2 [Oryzias melastigma]